MAKLWDILIKGGLTVDGTGESLSMGKVMIVYITVHGENSGMHPRAKKKVVAYKGLNVTLDVLLTYIWNEQYFEEWTKYPNALLSWGSQL